MNQWVNATDELYIIVIPFQMKLMVAIINILILIIEFYQRWCRLHSVNKETKKNVLINFITKKLNNKNRLRGALIFVYWPIEK